MINSKRIASGVTRPTDSTGATGWMNARHHVGGLIRSDGDSGAQPKQKRQMVRLLTCVLFLLSLSTRAVFAGEIKPYSQPDFDKLAAEGKAVLLDFRADWRSICAAQAPVIGELMAQSKYNDLTTFTIDFDKAKELLKTYKVELQSTLIVLTGKQEEGRSVGDTSREGIERLLNKVAH